MLRNWRACVIYLQSEKLTGLLKQLLSYDRLHFLTFMTDILDILKIFQKSCQSDSISILELLPMKDRLFERLESCKNDCVDGGWEQLFLNNVITTGNETHFYGFKLTRNGPLRNGRQQHLFTVTKLKNIIDTLIKNLKIRIGLDNSLYESLKPLEKIVASTLEVNLEACRSFIIPDMDGDSFISDYYAAADSYNYENENECNTPLQSLKKLMEFHPDEFHTLKIVLARVRALKPHSADVERLISMLNMHKLRIRST